MNGENFTVKEILTSIVLPKLEAIEEAIRDKADQADLEKLERRVDALDPVAPQLLNVLARVQDIEAKVTDREQVAAMVNEGLRASQRRGWSVRERTLQAAVGLAAIGSLILNALAH